MLNSDRRRFMLGLLATMGLAMVPLPALARRARPLGLTMELEISGMQYRAVVLDPLSMDGREIGRITETHATEDGFGASGEITDPEAIAVLQSGVVGDVSIGYAHRPGYTTWSWEC